MKNGTKPGKCVASRVIEGQSVPRKKMQQIYSIATYNLQLKH
jgi:hypothetical protein